MIRISHNAWQLWIHVSSKVPLGAWERWDRGKRGLGLSDARTIWVVGTADTKGEELAFLAARVRELGGLPVVVDVGTRAPKTYTDIAADQIFGEQAAGLFALSDRGDAVRMMSAAFAEFAVQKHGQGSYSGIVGIGGGGGTSIITAAMRRLPIGLPKVMVSTLASGDTSAFIGVSDLVMMPAVTDLAGLNRISREVLANAAGAIVGMTSRPALPKVDRPAVGLTMFGVTTDCVTAIVKNLGEAVEPVVFHATGTGGRAMEALVDSGLITGVIDITTTEIADLLCGGVLAAGPDRLDCIARMGIPYVGSLGACDMVNFWARETVPRQYSARRFYQHNANVTLMRTNAVECAEIGRWIGHKLNACEGPVRILVPMRGLSALDIEGGPFSDPEADHALFTALRQTLKPTDLRRLVELPLHINDPSFAQAAVAAYHAIRP